MTKLISVLVCLIIPFVSIAQSPIGKWKMISNTTLFNGQIIDSHADLVSVRPCAKNIVYEFTTDGKANLIANDCEEKYKAIQEKLWSKTQWKVEGTTITTSNSNFAVGNTYQLSFNGNKMTWKRDDEKMEYQKL